MKIGRPEIRGEGGRTTWSVAVESGAGARRLWYELPDEHAEMLDDSCDAAVAALLLPAMARGERIVVEGTLSAVLHHALAGSYQALVRQVIPRLERVEIAAGETRQATGAPPGVATGFSAGIDSYAVLADYLDGQVPPGLRVTHLLFNDVGSHEPGGEPVFLARRDRLRPVAERLGLPFVEVRSNLDAFYGPDLHYLLTHTPRNASVALLLQGGIGRFYYASTYPFAKLFVGETFSLAFCDAIALPLLSTETLTAQSVGSEYTRVEKTLRVAEVKESHATLDVCVDPMGAAGRTNCSRCTKCARTMLTLEIAGLLDRYEASFDLGTWRAHRAAAVREALASDDPLHREIVRFARSRGYPLPVRHRLAGRFRRKLRRLLRRGP